MTATRVPTFAPVAESVPTAFNAVELSFIPTDTQRQLRALFYTALDNHPIADADTITVALVEQLTNDSRIRRWWSVPGFRDWFENRVHIQAKAEYALDLLLDSIIDLATSDDPKAISSKVAATKLLLDCRGYTSKAAKPKTMDAEIPQDRAQLEAYVKKIQLALDKGDS